MPTDYEKQLQKVFSLSNSIEKIERQEKRKPIPDSIKRIRYIDSKGLCMKCGLNFTDKGLTEDYHHKDGNPANSNPKNIEVLCPNCHRKETLKQLVKKQTQKIKGQKTITKTSNNTKTETSNNYADNYKKQIEGICK